MSISSITRLAAVLGVLVVVVGVPVGAGDKTDERPSPSEDAKRLISADRNERERAAENLFGTYSTESFELIKALARATKDSREDRTYMSPLHSSILAVKSWNVLDAVGLLLPLVDYELDTGSLPDGLDIGGDYFFPAASALVTLRVETRDVVAAMKVCRTDRQLELLTWVLCQRASSPEQAKAILEADLAKHPNERIAKAIQLTAIESVLLTDPAHRS